MKKIIYIVLAILIIVGIAITATVGLNVDIIYKAHEEVSVYIGKETNIKEIQSVVKEVFGNQKTVISKVEAFNDMFLLKTETVSDEQIENLKQKVAERFEIEDATNIITKTSVSKLRLRDIIKPYISPSNFMPIITSTIIILIFMAFRFKKLGSIKIVLQTGILLIIAELLLLSIIAITRYPVNRYIIPAGLAVYIATIMITNYSFTKNLNEYKDENKRKEV